MAMTAQQQLESMVQANVEPTLTPDEIVALLSLSAVADSSGRAPIDVSWVATYDLNRAAAEGWKWKAGKVATQFDFSSGARETYSRSQVHAQCLAQAKEYRRKIAGSVILQGAIRESGLVGAVVDNL